ncbi:hypothetical protein H4R34_000453 [Dimargaris verticillata]|uniref:Damage-control phosphatase ARMT1-like metal-binding domain-containing protein n=1 Tax=Dimargaris verticillata TaxID=2761393 RepID=A0A9W8EB99_9FUNG|nr:hypothetical protein H4R34_000453 [Dimargaris verticillata]
MSLRQRAKPAPEALAANSSSRVSTDDELEPRASPNGTHHITVPNHRNIGPNISVDIGGSLTKVVYFSQHPSTPGGRLNFTWFETDHIDQCIKFIDQLLRDWDDANRPPARPAPTNKTTPDVTQATEAGSLAVARPRHVIKATGGGAHLFHDLFVQRLGVTLQKEDEMSCLVAGLNFFITKIPDEVFTYSHEAPMCFQKTPKDQFPYMLVNIGSGVSILKVTGNDEYERISGTSLGGGTLWGLLTLLTKAKNFDQMLELSKTGNNDNVDMLVGDIYGTNYQKIGLKSSTIASSMGKVFRKKLSHDTGFSDGDIACSLLYMVSNNIGQIAYLNAKIHNLERIYFGGSFIQGHPDTMHTLSYAIKFWSQGTMKALFLRHEGYLGAMGAYLKRTSRKSRNNSFYENFTMPQTIADKSLSAYGTLDQAPRTLKPFPLLASAETYEPDTLDLTQPESQEYWIGTLERRQPHVVQLASEWARARGDSEATGKAQRFDQLYRDHLAHLRQQPLAYGPLTLRHLLALREQCLQEVGLRDIFSEIKQRETHEALLTLPAVLSQVEAVTNEADRVALLLDNVLAGNMYDWGSQAVVSLLEQGQLAFAVAKEKVKRHSLYDNRQAFIIKLVSHHSPAHPQYRKAVIFVDNSGADIVLGILPFTLYLLSKDIHVLLACNSFPAVNDVTQSELTQTLAQVAHIVPQVQTYLDQGALQVMGTGNGTPCLDMSRLSNDLVRACVGDPPLPLTNGTDTDTDSERPAEEKRPLSLLAQHMDANALRAVDLVILEGMGRAIHTNFHARFLCDSLKVAVFKNDVIANALGAKIYDAICIFEPRGETAQLPES